MKRMKQVLALLLALVLALSLTPTVALADPPQGECREGGEHLWYVYEDTATCTQAGERFWRCRKCGIWWRESLPALGHDWREGEVIESDGLLGPRRVRYVCDRCYEVKVETEQPTGGEVLNQLRSNPPHVEGASALVITLQPMGGSLPSGADSSHTLTVAAEGGVEPYTYEWRGVDKGVTDYVDGSPVGYAVQSHSRRAAEEANRRRAAFYEQYLNYTREHFGVEDVEGAMRGWTELQIREYGDIELSRGDDPSYTATIGDCYYYCVVRDSSGQEVRSDKAFVGNTLYIAQQPQDTELKDGKAYLNCKAGGGSGKYTYEWYRDDKDHPLKNNSYVLIVEEPGEYFCCVRDGDQEAVSAPATVTKPTNASRPKIVLQPKGVTMKAKTSNHYKATLTCKATLDGEENDELIYKWQHKGKNGWVTIQSGHKNRLVLDGGSKKVSGQYRCVVINPETGRKAVSRTVQVQVKMECLNLHFAGHVLTGRIIGGVPPYRIVVIQHRPKDKAHPTVKTGIQLKVGAKGMFSKPMKPETFKYYKMVVKKNGDTDFIYARAYYSITVYDSLGQVYESKMIPYPGK